MPESELLGRLDALIEKLEAVEKKYPANQVVRS